MAFSAGPAHRDARASPASQFQADVSRSVASVRARQALCKREALSELLVREPMTLLNYEGTYLRDDGKSAAEADCANLEE